MATLALSENCTVELLNFNRRKATGEPCPICQRPAWRNGSHFTNGHTKHSYHCPKCHYHWSV